MKKYVQFLEIKSDLKEVRDKLEKIMTQINSLVQNKEEQLDIKLILNELVINGVVHGNQYSSNKKVFLKISLEGNSLEILVKDEGSGFRFDEKKYNHLDMKPTGRGLVIVNGLSDKFKVSEEGVFVCKCLGKRD